MREVFTSPPREAADAELSLYAGFASDADKQRFARVREAGPEHLTQMQGLFEDARYNELLLRYRARHHLQTLSEAERAHWQDFRERKFNHDGGLASLTLVQYREMLAGLRAQEQDPQKLRVLDELMLWPAALGL